jgi:hypothetical protein
MLRIIIRGIVTGATFSIGSRLIESAIEKYKEKKEEIKERKKRGPAEILNFRPRKEGESEDKKSS